MKNQLIRLLLIPVLTISFTAKAQPYLGVQVLTGTELYTHYKTPVLHEAGKQIRSGTPVLNPSIGLSGIWAFADDEDVMPYVKLNSFVTYSPFSIPYGSERTQGSANFAFLFGPGVYLESGLVQIQVLYGYQFNKIDLYKTNSGLSNGDRWFETHVIEIAGGFGLADWYTVAPFFKVGFNKYEARTFHFGVRFGVGLWNGEAAF